MMMTRDCDGQEGRKSANTKRVAECADVDFGEFAAAAAASVVVANAVDEAGEL